MADKLIFRILTPGREVLHREVESANLMAENGEVGILPGHAPLLALIGMGELSIDRPGGGSDTFHVAGGVLKVERNVVTLLTEYAGDEPAPEGSFDATDFAEAAGA